MSHEATFIDVHGARTEVLRGGKGSPLLYLHSAGGSFWSPFLDRVAERFSVYAPTLPGFGNSGGFERIDSIADLVFHTIDVIDELGLERVPVMGLSLGGWLAAELAVHHPERFAKLVLIDAIGLEVKGAPIAEFFLVDAAAARKLLFYEPESEMARTLVPDDPTGEALEAVLKAREATARVAWNPYLCNPKLRERLYRVKAPTLVVWGEDDRLVPLAHGEAYAAGITGAALVTVPRTSHAPSLERPEETARLVLDFLAR